MVPQKVLWGDPQTLCSPHSPLVPLWGCQPQPLAGDPSCSLPSSMSEGMLPLTDTGRFWGPPLARSIALLIGNPHKPAFPQRLDDSTTKGTSPCACPPKPAPKLPSIPPSPELFPSWGHGALPSHPRPRLSGRNLCHRATGSSGPAAVSMGACWVAKPSSGVLATLRQHIEPLI